MITEEERQRRHKFLGSSDIAKIVGCHWKQNIADCYYEKTEQLIPEKFGGSREAKMGIHLEGAILDMFEDAMDVKLERNIWLQHPTHPFCANLDAAIIEDLDFPQTDALVFKNGNPKISRYERIISPVEAKSTRFIENWGEDFDEAPLQVVVQVHWQMFLAGPQCRRGYAPVFFPKYKDFGFEYVPITRDQELIDDLEFAGREFMESVRDRKPPKDVAPALDTLKRVKREPESLISIKEDGAAVVKEWRQFVEKKSFTVSDVDRLKQSVIALLDNAEEGRLPDGSLIRYPMYAGSRHCDLDLVEFKLSRLQDEIERAKEMIRTATPGEAMAILESLNAPAVLEAAVTRSPYRKLYYKKPPAFKPGRKRR